MKRKECKVCHVSISAPHAKDCPNTRRGNNRQGFTMAQIESNRAKYRARFVKGA